MTMTSPTPLPSNHRRAQRRPARRRLAVLRLATLAAVLLVTPWALADALKLDGLWVPNVVVDSIADGEVIYRVQGAERARPLSELSGMKIDAYPDLGQAVDLMEAGQPAEAIPVFRRLIPNIREPWLRTYVNRQLITAMDAADQPRDAVTGYITLAIAPQTEAAYLARPPVRSLARLGRDDRNQLLTRVRDAHGRATLEPAKAGLQEIMDVLAAIEAAQTEGGGAVDPSMLPASVTGAIESAIAMPRRVIEDERDPIAAMLREGKFEEALAAINEELSRPTGTMSRLLYLRGLAQLNLAEQKNDESGFKDAGLSFARVVSYFRSSTQWTVPAYLELAYIHNRIGRPELADRLLAEGVGTGIDPELDPELYQRYLMVRGVDSDEGSPEASTND